MKVNLLKILLRLAAIFYLVGSVVHFFGLTLFPFYDGKLFSPYHDSMISMFCLFLSLLLVTVAKDPFKYKAVLKVIIVGFILISLFSLLIIFRIDFAVLGAPDKKMETITEGIVGLLYSVGLIYCIKD